MAGRRPICGFDLPAESAWPQPLHGERPGGGDAAQQPAAPGRHVRPGPRQWPAVAEPPTAGAVGLVDPCAAQPDTAKVCAQLAPAMPAPMTATQSDDDALLMYKAYSFRRHNLFLLINTLCRCHPRRVKNASSRSSLAKTQVPFGTRKRRIRSATPQRGRGPHAAHAGGHLARVGAALWRDAAGAVGQRAAPVLGRRRAAAGPAEAAHRSGPCHRQPGAAGHAAAAAGGQHARQRAGRPGHATDRAARDGRRPRSPGAWRSSARRWPRGCSDPRCCDG